MASFGWAAGGAHAATSVSNVRAGQRAGTKLVDIDYDITGTTGWVSVLVQVSADAGASYAVPAVAFTGDFGSVPAGRNRRVTWNAGADWNGTYSPAMRFQITASEAPAGMVLIPAGNFQMGNSANAAEAGGNELPVHTVYVSAFYMDRYEVTKALWDNVYLWAASHGYSFTNAGSGKASNHPVHTISWYDMVKWCNARSERDGLVPLYYTDDAQTVVYKTGSVNVTNAQVKWEATGYRLPTEAEWEKAARGGVSGQRFPWGATVIHAQANYYSSTSYAYDVSATRNYHPTFAVNGTPYTSPAGFFAPNGYGLYDMAGNVWEWCWDWWNSTYYSASPNIDPQGPPQASGRVFRGGAWAFVADYARVAFRSGGTTPADVLITLGFRTVRR